MFSSGDFLETFKAPLMPSLSACVRKIAKKKTSLRKCLSYTLFSIRTSNFGAEAERSYIFLRFEAENVLKTFLNLHGIINQLIKERRILITH